jgi:hypothetical protein
MSWRDLLGLWAICLFVAWVFMHIVADIICPSDRMREWRERSASRVSESEWRPVYDQDVDDV